MKDLENQWVCTRCGFNMVGFHPTTCPFCGAPRDEFISAKQCAETYVVKEKKVTNKVTRLNSEPRLGYEHAAYRIQADGAIIWIDCPSSFTRELEPCNTITFTHHHFLGAMNLYREKFNATSQIHERDANHSICSRFTFDETFQGDFQMHGIKAYHIDGHTPGFTVYIFEDIAFVCDYVFPSGDAMSFNPYGPSEATRKGGIKLKGILESKDIKMVCGWIYVEGYDNWKEKFNELLC